MHKAIALAVTLASATSAFIAVAQAQTGAPRVEWKIERANTPGSVQATFEWRTKGGRSVWSNDHRLTDFPGLSAAQLNGRGGDVRFAVVRPAGRLDCAGRGRNGEGNGTCAFTPDRSFSDLIAAQGLQRPNDHQALSLALGNVDRPLVMSLRQIRQMRPTIDQLASMGVHGVTADMIGAVARSGLPIRSANDIVSLRIHGADVAWVNGLSPYAARLRHLTGGDLVSLRVHGASPQWVGSIAESMGPQFSSVTGGELTSMRIHGAKPDMIKAYVDTFGGNLSGGDITSMAIHGVTADFIREVASLGYRNISAGDLVSMRLNGIPRNRHAAR